MNIIEQFKQSEAIKLALYIRRKYLEYEKNITQRIISPIKLQKSLYFLFAYWGQYIRKNKDNKDSVEVDYSDYNEYLFDDTFEAWTYGPVVPLVYRAEKDMVWEYIDNEFDNNYLQDDPVKKEFIDNLLEQLFDISDFGLVDLSHQDQCWKKYYNESEEKHNHIIPKDEIIDEYCNKTA